MPDATSHVILEPGEYLLRSNVAWEVVKKEGKQYLVGISVAGVRSISTLGNVTSTSQQMGSDHISEIGAHNAVSSGGVAATRPQGTARDNLENEASMVTSNFTTKHGIASPGLLDGFYVQNHNPTTKANMGGLDDNLKGVSKSKNRAKEAMIHEANSLESPRPTTSAPPPAETTEFLPSSMPATVATDT